MALNRRHAWVSVLAGVAVGVMLALTGVSGSWTPLEHTVCADGAMVAQETDRWLPFVLVNSPYGGAGSGAGGPSAISGITIYNGTAGANFLQAVDASLYLADNSSAWGTGTNHPCNRHFNVALGYHLYGSEGVILPTTSNLTDFGEVNNFSLSNASSDLNDLAFFNNSFTVANTGEITTCREASRNLPIRSDYLSIGIPFEVGNRTLTVPYTLPFPQNFTYTFPANFGPWAIDNLSAPGGPGGGLAFDYLGGCPSG